MKPAPADRRISLTLTVKPCGRPELRRVVREGILRLGHADGQVGLAERLDLLDHLFGRRAVADTPPRRRCVDAIASIFSFIGERGVVERMEIGRVSRTPRRRRRASSMPPSPPLREHLGEREPARPPAVQYSAMMASSSSLSAAEAVDGHDHRHAELLHVLHVAPRGCTRPFSSASDVRLRHVSALGTPPLYLSARTVATSTTQPTGQAPRIRHLMSMNFSAPRSEPKPASVMRVVGELQGQAWSRAPSCSRARCWRTARRA